MKKIRLRKKERIIRRTHTHKSIANSGRFFGFLLSPCQTELPSKKIMWNQGKPKRSSRVMRCRDGHVPGTLTTSPSGRTTLETQKKGFVQFFLSRWRKNSFWLLFLISSLAECSVGTRETGAGLLIRTIALCGREENNIFTFPKLLLLTSFCYQKNGIKTNSNKFFFFFVIIYWHLMD